MSETEDSTVASWLADHPRLIGITFAVLLALSQASSALANGAGTTQGP